MPFRFRQVPPHFVSSGDGTGSKCAIQVTRNSSLIITDMLIYYTDLNLAPTRPHYSYNFGSEKIGPRTIKLALYIYNNDKTLQR